MQKVMLSFAAIGLLCGLIGNAASAATISTDYTATADGTPITIGNSATPQYSFVLGTFFNGDAQYKLVANNGATVAFPDNGVPQFKLAAVTTRLEGVTFTDGDYQLMFDIGSQAYTGLATVSDEGRLISAISYSAVGVPEPAEWAILLAGFLAMGSAMRYGNRVRLEVSA